MAGPAGPADFRDDDMAGCGLYVHVPFCRAKCPYCAFVSHTGIEHARAYVDAVVREIALRADPKAVCGTVHFGGGTPTVLGHREIARILSVLFGSFSVAPGAEIAIEANPGTVDEPSLRALRSAGFNRLSIGVQSFDDSDLRFLGRIHDAVQARDAFRAAREAGFENVGLDLIYGLPGRGADHWLAQMDEAAALGPEHVSCYALTVEQGTRLARDEASGVFEMPSEDEARGLFILTHEHMARLGYPAYEVSNFSRGGEFPSRHNSSYWTLRPYLGFGPSAHSFEPPRRSWNVKSLHDYIDTCVSGETATEGHEDLSPAQGAMEMVSLGLRTSAGVDLEALEARFVPGFRARNLGLIEDLAARSLASLRGANLSLTLEGLVLADHLSGLFEY